jgi:hypothetical protein
MYHHPVGHRGKPSNHVGFRARQSHQTIKPRLGRILPLGQKRRSTQQTDSNFHEIVGISNGGEAMPAIAMGM